jgi:predicted DNA binding protein
MSNGNKAKLLVELKNTPIVQIACKRSGVSRATYYRWRKEDTGFADKADSALEQSASLINDMAESQLISAIKDKNLTAIIFWLKNHHKTYETCVAVDAKLRFENPELTPEQTALVQAALENAGLLKDGVSDGETL